MAFFSTVIALLAQGRRVRAAILTEHEFNEGTSYNWTGVGDLDLDGHIWTGKGELVKFSALQFGADDGAQPFTMTLSGVDPSSVVEARTMPTARGRSQRIWLQFFDADSQAPIDSKYLLADRLMDVMGYSGVGPSQRTISLTSEDIWSGLNSAERATYSDADQQALFPGDRGLEFVAELAPGTRIEWPDFSNE